MSRDDPTPRKAADPSKPCYHPHWDGHPGADLHHPHPTSSLAALPLVRWASHFQRGSVILRGTLCADQIAPLGGLHVHVGPGEVEIRLSFAGGDAPCFERVALTGPLAVEIADDRLPGRQLDVDADELRLDGTWVPSAEPRLGTFLEAVVLGMSDVSIEATGDPDGDLLMRFSAGVRATVPRNARVTVNGTANGTPDALQLSAPLVVRFGGSGIRLSHDHLTRLSRLAKVEIHRAILHPDGSVDLDVGAAGPFGRAVRGGIARASQRLSDLVRTGPQFARIRTFLVV